MLIVINELLECFPTSDEKLDVGMHREFIRHLKEHSKRYAESLLFLSRDKNQVYIDKAIEVLSASEFGNSKVLSFQDYLKPLFSNVKYFKNLDINVSIEQLKSPRALKYFEVLKCNNYYRDNIAICNEVIYATYIINRDVFNSLTYYSGLLIIPGYYTKYLSSQEVFCNLEGIALKLIADVIVPYEESSTDLSIIYERLAEIIFVYTNRVNLGIMRDQLFKVHPKDYVFYPPDETREIFRKCISGYTAVKALNENELKGFMLEYLFVISAIIRELYFPCSVNKVRGEIFKGPGENPYKFLEFRRGDPAGGINIAKCSRSSFRALNSKAALLKWLRVK